MRTKAIDLQLDGDGWPRREPKDPEIVFGSGGDQRADARERPTIPMGGVERLPKASAPSLIDDLYRLVAAWRGQADRDRADGFVDLAATRRTDACELEIVLQRYRPR